ncbi:MAG: MBL fold metallo-hydrolase [Candidatus Lokiarchaeota archaeon]|nr:MBL fold metallo-hydrolase [Candidatus Lokiarchaeota archaeon]
MSLQITWYGTACFIAHLDDANILFDPFFSRNENARPIINTKPVEINAIDAIFITHAHFDHITEAGFFAENLNVPVYCSETAKENIIRWMNGEIIESHKEEFSKRAEQHINTINYGESIKVGSNLEIHPIKSCHISFDARTILSRLFSWNFLKQLKTISKYGRGFPQGKVFGYRLLYKDLSLITFGSLCVKYIQDLEQYKGCDVLLIPYAGNSTKHMVEKTIQLIDVLEPSILIPHHWDNFFPPLSREEDLNSLKEEIKQNYPEINLKILPFEEKTSIT